MLHLGPQHMVPGTVWTIGDVTIGFDHGRRWWIHAPPAVKIQQYLPGMEAAEIKGRCEAKKGQRA